MAIDEYLIRIFPNDGRAAACCGAVACPLTPSRPGSLLHRTAGAVLLAGPGLGLILYIARHSDLLPENSASDNLESPRMQSEEEQSMKRSRYTEEQMIEAVKQMEAGRPTRDVARELGVTDQTLYNWRSRYSGMEASEARRLRALEEENRRLKTLVAELSLDREALKAVIRKNGWSL